MFFFSFPIASSSGLGRKSVVVDDDLHDGEANNAENNNNNNEEGIPSSGRRECKYSWK